MPSRSMILTLLILLLLVQVGIPLVLHLARNSLIFLPSHEPEPAAGLAWVGPDVELELVSIERPDGRRLAAYDARPVGGASEFERVPTLVFFHGNAGNLALRAPLVGELVRGIRARVLLFDYSGYGGNEGDPSPDTVVEDGLAAMDHLIGEGLRAEEIVLVGESLGCAVALAVAEARGAAGVVLHSPFSSLESMARRLYPWLPLGAVLQRGVLPNDRRVASLQAPLLLVHGTNDQIIPFAESERLLQSAPPSADLWAIEGAGHNDLFAVAGDEYYLRLRSLVRQWSQARPQSGSFGSSSSPEAEKPSG